MGPTKQYHLHNKKHLQTKNPKNIQHHNHSTQIYVEQALTKTSWKMCWGSIQQFYLLIPVNVDIFCWNTKRCIYIIFKSLTVKHPITAKTREMVVDLVEDFSMEKGEVIYSSPKQGACIHRGHYHLLTF